MVIASYRWSVLAVFLLFSALLYLIYSPGLHGDFLFDDGSAIVNNDWVQIDTLSVDGLVAASLSFDGGPLKRPVAMFTFAINHYLSGLDPYSFKLTNVLIHWLNGIAIFALARLLLVAWRRRLGTDWSDGRIVLTALAVSGVWLFHPLALTSVLYVVQRMTSLAALFTFASMAFYLAGRLRQWDGRRGWPLMTVALGICAPLAAFSKENALLLPLYLLLIEWLVLDFAVPDEQLRSWLRKVTLWLVVVGAVAVVAYMWTYPQFVMGSYLLRDFTPAERLMTEARVGWWYLGMTYVPVLSQLGLFHDDFGVSAGLLNPPVTLVAIVGWVVYLVAALWFHRRYPVAAFGALFFLAGHLLESTIFGLELVHEHRNYLPMFGPLMLLAWAALLAPPAPRHRGAVMAAVAVMLLFAGVTAVRASAWSEPLGQWYAEIRHHPDSPRVNFEFARLNFALLQREVGDPVERERRYQMAREHFERSHRFSDAYSAGLFGLILLESEMERAPREEEVEELRERLARNPVSSYSVVLIKQIAQCRSEGGCEVSDELLRRMLDTMLANPIMIPSSRAMLNSEAAVVALRMNRWGAALEHARRAAELAPEEGQHRLNHIQLLLLGGRLPEAREELESLKAANLVRLIPLRMEMLERSLAEAERHQAEDR